MELSLRLDSGLAAYSQIAAAAKGGFRAQWDGSVGLAMRDI